ncbi:MAG: hypothetical protein Q9208_006614 [Pyrenodesmia sp. 3 TL-2023]
MFANSYGVEFADPSTKQSGPDCRLWNGPLDPNAPQSKSKGSSRRRFGTSKVRDDCSYPLTSTSGNVGITTNEISSGRLAGPRDSDLGIQSEEFSLEELEAQRAPASKSPRDGIKVKKEWRVQRH